jgi:hypothetical protein
MTSLCSLIVALLGAGAVLAQQPSQSQYNTLYRSTKTFPVKKWQFVVGYVAGPAVCVPYGWIIIDENHLAPTNFGLNGCCDLNNPLHEGELIEVTGEFRGNEFLESGRSHYGLPSLSANSYRVIGQSKYPLSQIQKISIIAKNYQYCWRCVHPIYSLNDVDSMREVAPPPPPPAQSNRSRINITPPNWLPSSSSQPQSSFNAPKQTYSTFIKRRNRVWYRYECVYGHYFKYDRQWDRVAEYNEGGQEVLVNPIPKSSVPESEAKGPRLE